MRANGNGFLKNPPIDWGRNCTSEKGQKLRDMLMDPNNKPIASVMATVLGTSRGAVFAAISKYKLPRHPNWQHPAKDAGVRQHGKQAKPKRIGKASTLPPLQSLKDWPG